MYVEGGGWKKLQECAGDSVRADSGYAGTLFPSMHDRCGTITSRLVKNDCENTAREIQCFHEVIEYFGGEYWEGLDRN